MEREGAKEATAKLIQLEDDASSTRLRLFLGCGKRPITADPKDNIGKTSEMYIHGWTSTVNPTSELRRLDGLAFWTGWGEGWWNINIQALQFSKKF